MTTADDLTTRFATTGDARALANLMFRAPSREAVALAGSAAAAERFGARMLELAVLDGARIIVLDDGDVPVGFAEVSTTGDVPPLRVVAGIAIDTMGVIGALQSAWRSLPRMRVDMKPPPGGMHLVELQAAPERRNQGLGGRLLDEVERLARQEGAQHISLTTAIDNPARRLYERSGYEVVDERRNARYLARTGSPGRVLMVKQLDGH